MLIGLGLFIPFQGFGTGHIIVYASDTSKTGVPPPSATATLDGSISQTFGAHHQILFSNLTAGVHSVEVTSASNGYLPRESPHVADAVDDPYSDYGNPRYIEVSDDEVIPVNFRFDPLVTLSAVVRDAWTMERLENASVTFVFQGSTGGVTVCKYPSTATYATPWCSAPDGTTLPGPCLYLQNYDITITLSNFQTFTSNNIITNASAGDTFDLGEIFLLPVDNNTNRIADVWETLYFGSGTTVIADADADGDGVNNRDEYVAGTDPTQALSFLDVAPSFGSNRMELAWNTAPWRTYRVAGTTSLRTGEWVQVAGTWEATNGQSGMSWAETNTDLSWNSNYRIDVVPCNWQETNQVLVNTNRPVSGEGGGGGGTNGPPIP